MDEDVEPRDTERSGRAACLGCSKPFACDDFDFGGLVILTALPGRLIATLYWMSGARVGNGTCLLLKFFWDRILAYGLSLDTWPCSISHREAKLSSAWP